MGMQDRYSKKLVMRHQLSFLITLDYAGGLGIEGI